ncbi:MAG: hypothetical protein J6A01_04840 [Proteobacteria bacterium]|nr:hypothetical protein [Pseudomonadota bacterium]
MTPSGLMIIGYPALACIVLGTALVCTLVSGFLIRRLPKGRVFALIAVFLLTAVLFSVWLYYRFNLPLVHVEVIRGL